MSALDWSPPRRKVATVTCPECSAPYPRELVAAIGEVSCGRCGTSFVIRSGYGVTRLRERPEAIVAATHIVQPPPRKPRTYRRADASGKTSTSVRTSQSELEAWRAAAEAAGMTLNGWLRRELADSVALERASQQYPPAAPKEGDET